MRPEDRGIVIEDITDQCNGAEAEQQGPEKGPEAVGRGGEGECAAPAAAPERAAPAAPAERGPAEEASAAEPPGAEGSGADGDRVSKRVAWRRCCEAVRFRCNRGPHPHAGHAAACCRLQAASLDAAEALKKEGNAFYAAERWQEAAVSALVWELPLNHPGTGLSRTARHARPVPAQKIRLPDPPTPLFPAWLCHCPAWVQGEGRQCT